MKPLGLPLIFLFAVTVYGVDRNNFKTCDQSGFCKRLRSFKPEKSQYTLNLDTVIVHGNILSAEVSTVNTETENKIPLWKYALTFSALVDGTFRIQIDEADPIYPRYRTQLALDGEPKADGLQLVSKEGGKLTLTNTQGHKVLITAEPLKFEFLDQNGDVAVVINENSQLLIEPLRLKREKNDEEEGNENAIEVEEEGTWGENFKSHHDSKPRGNEAVSLDVSFPDADQIYGIPEHTDKFALRTTTSGEPYRLYNLDVFEYELDSRMAIYGAVPVLYAHGSKRTVGVFWHNSAETWVDVVNYADGTVVSSLVNLVTGGHKRRVDARFISESGIVDVFVMLGSKPADVFRQYTKLTGVAPLPPKFSLAYHQSRWNYVDEADVRAVDDNFDVHDIPADVIWLDIEYTDRKKYFTWDPEKFRHPADMVANLTAKGRKLVVIIDPHIKREAGYFVHEDATEQGLYVKDKDGNIYEGWCWPGSSSYLDFFNPAASKYYSERYRFENFPGTSKNVHIWNDMNEPSVFNGPEITMPKDCRHYKPPYDGQEGLADYWEHRHVHNEYGLWQIRATQEGLLQRADHNYRPFILTRSTFAGTQRYGAVWTGKPRDSLIVLISIISNLQLLCSRYTLFYEHTLDGTPVTRPYFQEYPNEEETYTIDDQYLLGDKLLVRPVLEAGVKSVKVYLPGRETNTLWYDVDSYQVHKANGYFNQEVNLAKIPVYQRGGAVVPRRERVRRSSTLMANDPFTLVVTLDANNTAHGTLYIDDGETYEYKNNKYIYAKIAYEPNQMTYTLVNPSSEFSTRAWIERIVIAGVQSAPRTARLQAAGRAAALHMTLHRGNNVLVIRKPAAPLHSHWTIHFTQ
ncbi:PREDICTED: neutral alpha-glucosidase AB [Papilio polytes]|uniref:neutral alpha-glucosidase AB n=1 Tax=Papilio polytes TaxID=76194 RepID=UPI000675C4A6|nr:PREDICTED: neutral alpha-glucosidase AB [Papilio polytes]